MTALPATQPKSAPPLYSEGQLKLIRNTVARDLYPEEFDLFVSMCRGWGLDPTRRQIYANVYSKDDPKKRRVVYVTGIDGYRAIADRTGDYRPGERSVEVDPDIKDPKTNPYGIVSATAQVWKHAHGEWHSYTETVYWDEFAPIKQWKEEPPYLDRSGQWPKMGRVMLMKCAEAAALRRGWPDSFAGLYTDDEMAAADILDLTASEVVEAAATRERQERIGGPSLIVTWEKDTEPERVNVDDFYGLVQDKMKSHSASGDLDKIVAFQDRNGLALQDYWVHKKPEALDLKRSFEAVRKKIGETKKERTK